ncbi:extracellular solute-binding protein [Paenibacillus hodogayensis]|uniref:Extracellular solute-binding protein n=1 Tax=Paenibacillus hodogayensis TaxID=279208 RepID=A0ABV5VXX5_9BACL
MIGKKRTLWAIIALAAMVTVSAACNKNGGDGVKESGDPVPPKQTAGDDGPFAKYDPPIDYTTVRSVNAGVKFKAGESYDNNIWMRDYESKLGIKLKNKWKVSDQQYQNKMNVMMVSGDLPDFMLVDAQQFQTLVQAGQITDLTEIYKKYASDLSKKILESGNGIPLKTASVGGKLMGIPNGGGSRDDAPMLFIRNDWLKNVGLEPPKTMDDVIKIALAFTKNDPDKNGKNDTYGLSLDQNLWNGWSGLDGFFNGYHAYPYNPTKGSGTNLMFLKGPDGKAMWADTQPEMKTALGKLQELFKAGAIYPEFSVIDGNKSAELATSNKVGMTFGAFFVPTWPINNMKKDNPEADWGVYPLVSADAKPVKAQSTGGLPAQFWVVSKSSKHPEAVFKLLNYTMEKLYGETKDVAIYHTVDEGNGQVYNVHMYPPINGGLPEKNQETHYAVLEALQKGDGSKLNQADKAEYDSVVKYKNGDLNMWSKEKLWNAGGVFEVLGKYKKENRVVQTAYLGAPTQTMTAKGPSLRDLEVKSFTEIIIGAKPLDSFDDFVKKWMEQGGKQILDEVNESGQLQ